MTAFFPILEISTSVGCRMACSYCPQATHVKNYAAVSDRRKLSFDDFRKALDHVPRNVRISFAGMAEPWLNSETTAMVVHASEEGHDVDVYTTLWGLPLGDIEILSKLRFTAFVIHLPDENGWMNLKVDDAYLDKLKACRERIPHHYSAIGKPHPAVSLIVGKVDDSSGGLISRAGNLPDRKITRKTGPLSCTACGPKLDHNVMLPSGDVVLCCMDYSVQHVIGNLVEQSWDSLFEGDGYKTVMRGLDGDESVELMCRYCELSTSR